MNIENVIKQQAVKLKSSRRDIDIVPDIMPDTIEKWKKKYSRYLEKDISEFILVMSYTKTGSFVLTGRELYFDNYVQDGLVCVKFKEIIDATARSGNMLTVDKVFIETLNGSKVQLDGAIDGINIDEFVRIIKYIAKKAKESKSDFSVSKQGIMSYDLPEELKILYLKILCNYSYINDQNIDQKEYNAISRFSVRMELKSKSRMEYRKYVNSIKSREQTGILINKVKILVTNNSGQWDAFRYCLMQDILYIHNIQKDKQSWREDGFIGSLMEVCDLYPNQIDTMLVAVDLNRRMQQKNENLKELKKEWERLNKKVRYTSGYIPCAYLFCSGSIYGIKIYNNFFKNNDNSLNAINKLRELILHEIIINNQKTMNVLIDDMNDLADQIEKAVTESNENKEKYDALIRKLISRLAATKELRTDTEEKNEECKGISRKLFDGER